MGRLRNRDRNQLLHQCLVSMNRKGLGEEVGKIIGSSNPGYRNLALSSAIP